jgi:hypothetical protein
MHNKSAPLLLTLAVSLLTACITVSTPTQESAGTPLFITSTLAPTKQLAALPSRTPTDRGGTPTPAITAPPNCKEQAVLLEDVTVPDNTKMEAGESFTKTWKLKNTGTCPWAGYTLAFADGDRMGAPDSTPVPQTVSGAEVDISVELIAPQTDGAYTGNFSLRNAEEEIVKIGLEDSMWVKILVGDGTISPTANPNGTPVSNGSSDIGNCNYELNAGYASQILSLINSARAEAGVSTLSVNAQLTAAARAHSADMGCHNMTGHTGSNG